jgi:hypothetical protein
MPSESLGRRQNAMRKRMSASISDDSGAAVVVPEATQPASEIPIDWTPRITEYYGSKVISREDLYKLVWSEAMIKIAVRLGVSDVAVAKACRKHNIPLPGRGYWACITAGQNLPRTSLPKLSDSSIVRVTFRPQLKKEVPRLPSVEGAEIVLVEPPSARLHPFAKETKSSIRQER